MSKKTANVRVRIIWMAPDINVNSLEIMLGCMEAFIRSDFIGIASDLYESSFNSFEVWSLNSYNFDAMWIKPRQL